MPLCGTAASDRTAGTLWAYRVNAVTRARVQRDGQRVADQEKPGAFPGQGCGLSADLPGGAISFRPLRFYWVLDASGSMAGQKIGELNHAIREALRSMRDSAAENPHVRVEVRAMAFSTGCRWITAASVPLTEFVWSDISVSGITDMGAAMKAMAAELSVANMPERGLPPVIVLVSDGQPTDDFQAGLNALLAEPWGKRAMRVAIGIGDDADFDVLRSFIARSEIEPFSVYNPDELVKFMRFVSTTALKAASSPRSQSMDTKVHWPPPPPPPPFSDDDQVW